MKRNAIVRIVLWSIVLVVLLSILFIRIYVPGAGRRLGSETPVETMVAVPLPRVSSPETANAIARDNINVRSTPDADAKVVAFAEEGTLLQILRQETIGSKRWGYIGAPTQGWVDLAYVELFESPVEETFGPMPAETVTVDTASYNAVVTADGLNVRTIPSTEAPNAGMVKKGDHLLISKQETVNEILWGYTPVPVNGWVVMEYVELLEPTDVEITTLETTAAPENELTGYGVALDAASIKNMEIEWAAGSITIQPMDITEIRISEQGINQSADPMVWKVRDGTLSIQYSKNTDHDFGMGLVMGTESKALMIQVPFQWQCNFLEIDAASASLEVKDLTIREMEFDGASGICVFSNCTVEKLDLDTASGDVRFQGTLNQLECDSASANILLELNNVPKSLEMDTASGNLEVILPEDAGFTATMDSLSGKFQSDFTTTQRNGSHVAGNGRCRIEVDAMSGSVYIFKSA